MAIEVVEISFWKKFNNMEFVKLSIPLNFFVRINLPENLVPFGYRDDVIEHCWIHFYPVSICMQSSQKD